jgi:hypothetical protein
MKTLSEIELEEIAEYNRRTREGNPCSCNVVTAPPCQYCESTVELPCLNCGKLHNFHYKSYEASGIFNVFCNNNCEDLYAFKL